ncbi:TPA: hypothetical protein ACNMQV_005021 [Klebsiella pneumoniae]|jgi:hypothetical protein|nr:MULTISPECIES: hypothetical protein [Enterobacterales]EGU4537336.1 hypothetical protein [Salmonella enterica]EHV1159855.1 hypothetical protein [Shigella flexneri]EJA5427517.1 hypothetical protein [Salmonella enterica subsp. enterica serovar Enteritidis]ELS5435470.1 hypothetical protein [Citrobacter freundii]ELY2734904.1 hypothetical protein [Cronobacter sakazakii]
MKKIIIICAVLCTVLGLTACGSSPEKLTQPKGDWIDANPTVTNLTQGVK